MPDQESPTSVAPKEQPQVPAMEGAVPKVSEGAVQKVTTPEVTQPRTYTQDEWSKRESKLNRQLKETEERLKERETQLSKEVETAREEAENARFDVLVKKAEEAGGDVNIARFLAEEGKKLSKERREFLRTKAETDEKLKLVTFLEFRERAQGLVKEHNLDPDTLEDLLAAKTYEEMENKALKAAVEKQKAEQRLPAKLDSGELSGGKTDFSSLPETQKAGMLMDNSVRRRSK